MATSIVSIITPTYNHAHYIGECIESVLAQTYTDWEMLIIDDGSTDETWEVVQRYAIQDSRIRPFYQANKGIWKLHETYNFALSQARGDFIAILEGDDVWPVHTLQVLTEQLIALPQEYGLVYGQSTTFGYTQGDIIGTSYMSNVYDHPAEFAHQIYTPIARIPPQATIIRKNVIDMIGGFQQPPTLPLVDRPTFLALALITKFYHLPQILAYWRQHEQNTTRVLSLRMTVGAIPWVKTFFATLPPTVLPYLRVSRARALRIHRQYVFQVAASYLQELEHNDDRAKRWMELRNHVMAHLNPVQNALLRVEYFYILVGIDMRPFVRTVKKLFHCMSGLLHF